MPEKICTDCIHSDKCIQAKRHRYVGGCGRYEKSGPGTDYRPDIMVVSMKEAEEISEEITEPAVFISITSPRAPKAEFHMENPNVRGVFRMRFHDTDDGENDGLRKPQRKDFTGLKDFIDRAVEEKTPLIIVHCEGGISRSAGVACAVDDYLGVGKNFWKERYLHPNIRVYRMACKEFGIAKTQEDLEEVFSVRQEHSAYSHGADRQKYPKVLRNR